MKHPAPIRSAGFTITELLIVVGIISVLATIAFPSYVRARQKGQNTQTLADLRTFQQGFLNFYVDTSTWPDDRMPGQFPDRINGQPDLAMEQVIRRTAWERKVPVGGVFDWDYNVNGVIAAVAIANPTAGNAQLQDLDKAFDDGDLATGALRQVPSGLIYVIEELPTP